MIGALALSAYSQRLMPAAFAMAAVAIFVCVGLALREGAVLAKWGIVCEKKKDRFGYWFYIATHSFFGAFCLLAAIFSSLPPSP